MTRAHVYFLFMIGATACGDGASTPAPRPTDEPAPPEEPAQPEPAGFDDQVGAVLACDWDDRHGFDYRCGAVRAWLRPETNLDEPRLVALLEHDDERHRHVAAIRLQRLGRAFRRDAALARRMVAVSQAERSAPVSFALGWAIARVDLEATGVADDLERVITEHPDPVMRAHAVLGLVEENPRSERAYAIVLRALEAVIHNTALEEPERLADPAFTEEVGELAWRYLRA